MSDKEKFLSWALNEGYTTEDFITRKAELQAEYAESQKVRGKNRKSRAVVSIFDKDGNHLGDLPEMDFRLKDAQMAAYMWLLSEAPTLGISIDREDISRCKVEARKVTVETIDCGHVADAFR